MESTDALVGAWLTVPDLAERLGLPVGRARRLIEDRRVLALRRGEPRVLSVPERFLVPADAADAADADPDDRSGAPSPQWQVLSSLPGTITVLADAGFDDEASLRWLFSEDEVLGAVPIDQLRLGHKAPVRRRAQMLA